MPTGLTEEELKNEIRRLGPFHHKVELPYGLSTHVPELSRRKREFTRLSNLVRHAFPALLDVCGGSLAEKRVLDVACNCGAFSVEAARRKAQYVLGIDVVDRYIEQAKFIKRALDLEQIEFQKMSVESVDESNIGLYDVTFCFGILYHFENPVAAMKRLASVTKHIMLVDTDVLKDSAVRRPFVREPLWLMNVPPPSTTESTSLTTNLWRSTGRVVQFCPNEIAVMELLKFLGFHKVEKLTPKASGLEARYYKGTRATFLALR